MTLWSPRRCNCLIWAVVMWFRHGGRVRALGSIHGWWPHWVWLHEGRVYEYAPPEHQHGRKLPPIIFTGRVQEVVGERIIRVVRVGGEVIAERINRLKHV